MYNPMGMSDVMVGQQNYLMGYEKASGRTFMGPDNGLSKTYYQAWQDPELIAREVGMASYYHSMENAMASQARAQANAMRMMADAQAYAGSRYSGGYPGGWGSHGGGFPQMPYNPYAGAYRGYPPAGGGYGGYGGYGGDMNNSSLNMIIMLLQMILNKIPSQPNYYPVPTPYPIYIPVPTNNDGSGWGNDGLPRPPVIPGPKPQPANDNDLDLSSLLPLLLLLNNNNNNGGTSGPNGIIRPGGTTTTTGGGHADPWVFAKNIDFDRDGKLDELGRPDRMSATMKGSFADLHFHGEAGKVYNIYNTTGGDGNDGLILNAKMEAYPFSHAKIDTNGDGKLEDVNIKQITGKDGTVFSETNSMFYGHSVSFSGEGKAILTMPDGKKIELTEGSSQSFKTNAKDAQGNPIAGFVKFEKVNKETGNWKNTNKVIINVGNMEVELLAYEVKADNKTFKFVDIVHQSVSNGTDIVDAGNGKANNLTGVMGMLFGQHNSKKDIVDFLNKSIKDVDKRLSEVFERKSLDDTTFTLFDTQKGLEKIKFSQGINNNAGGGSGS